MKGIPNNITFYCQNIPVKTVNEITGEDYGFVLPAWAKDSNGKNDAAINWAKNVYGRNDSNNSIKPCRVVTIPNSDIIDIIITDISYRGQGSKVFKALVHGIFLIDISAECLLEVISCGKIEDGRIKSPMFFGTANNKLSLILRDGKFHKDILFRNLPDIKVKDLKKYHVYEKLNSKVIYLSNNNFVQLTTHCDSYYDRVKHEYIQSI